MTEPKQIQQKSNIAYILSLNPDILFGLSIQQVRPTNDENSKSAPVKNLPSCSHADLLYGLYMLLLFYGQKIHKDIILGKIKDCIRLLQQQINKNEHNFQNNNTKQQILVKKINKIIIHRVKCLKFLQKQLQLNYTYNNQKLQQIRVNTAKQIEQINRAFITIYKNQIINKNIENIKFQDPKKWLCKILGIKHRIVGFYDYQTIQFDCPSFIQSDIEVYIQINKSKKTYKYIKQKTQTVDTFNKLVKSHGELKSISIQNLMLYSDIIKRFSIDSSGFQFNNNSFLRLLRVESSRQQTMSSMMSVLFPGQNEGASIIEANSQVIEQSSVLNESVCRKRSSSLPSVLGSIIQSQEIQQQKARTRIMQKTQNVQKIEKIQKIQQVQKIAQKAAQKIEESKYVVVQQSILQCKIMQVNSFIFYQCSLIQSCQSASQDKFVAINNVLTTQSQEDAYKISINTHDNSHKSLQMKIMTAKQNCTTLKIHSDNQNNLIAQDSQIKGKEKQQLCGYQNVGQKCQYTKKKRLDRKFQDKIQNAFKRNENDKKNIRQSIIIKSIFNQKGIINDIFCKESLFLTKSASLSRSTSLKLKKPPSIQNLKGAKLQYSN